MKILILSSVYPEVEQIFYNKFHNLESQSYLEQKEKFDSCYFNYHATGWSEMLNLNGYHAENIVINMKLLQKTWAKEYLSSSNSYSEEDIVIQQIKLFSPDILWFNAANIRLLQKIREGCPKIRMILGWVGSALFNNGQEKYLDVVLSCAQESVECLKRKGVQAEQIHHAFPLSILQHLNTKKKLLEGTTFIGQIVRGEQFHFQREEILLSIGSFMPIKIYSPSFYLGYKDIFKGELKKFLYDIVQIGESVGIKGKINKMPILSRVQKWKSRPCSPINFSLKKHLFPPVFGVDMFNTIHQSSIVLNIHADSSPQYASNMRLFEVTGAGSCLATDWKQNIQELFIPDEEIITYSSVVECVEKINWLNNHPIERANIAAAGYKRCINNHGYINRLERFKEIINKYI